MKFPIRKCLKIATICGMAFQMHSLSAEAIVGGIENLTDPYAAIIDSFGVATKVTGDVPIPTGRINSVRMNSLGNGILGGIENGNVPYIAFSTPTGVVTRITAGATPIVPGTITSVAINESGAGVVGGQHNTTLPFLALISPSGTAMSLSGADLPVGNGIINFVDINDSGAGIIGGRDNGTTDPYAAIFTPAGVVTNISGAGAPTGTGTILSVAVNNSGEGIIGGRDNGDNDTYAAVVSPTGVATEIFGVGAPTGTGEVLSVAINNSGIALIGGEDNNVPYAARVATSGAATPLTGFVTINFGQINVVDINSSGAGIIGGEHNDHNDAYAALVSPSGVITVITGDLPTGNTEYSSAAISESGIGILGALEGGAGNAFYAALVSPSGVATRVTGEVGITPSIAFSEDIIDLLLAAEPTSFGPGNVFADTVLGLSTNVLTNHLRRPPEREPEPPSDGETAGLTASVGNRIYQPPGCEKPNYAIWMAPYGLFATYDKGHSFPKLDEWSVGGIIGLDYLGWENVVFGGGAAYSYQDIDYSSNLGDANIHQEILTIYAAWYGNHISINGALWGGIYQLHNKRKTLGSITSTSNIDGGIFAPHLEVGAPFKINNTVLTVEPYVMFDWVNNWQGSVKEHGSSGLNLRIDSHYVSLLRSEIGLNLTQHLQYRHGDLTFDESVSYVNRATFNANKEQAFFVGSASTISVQIFSDRVENLGALRLSTRYTPCRLKYPYVSLTYLGEFGANLILNTVALEVGMRF